jgi:uncharacterized membrane protein YheB (UPF0754 family)
MIVKAIKKFGDKTTGETYAEQVKIEEGQVFECDDELAKERIKKKLVKKATKEEEKEYEKNKEQWAVTQEDDGKVHARPIVDGEIIDTLAEEVINSNDDAVPISTEQEEQQMIDDINNNCD